MVLNLRKSEKGLVPEILLGGGLGAMTITARDDPIKSLDRPPAIPHGKEDFHGQLGVTKTDFAFLRTNAKIRNLSFMQKKEPMPSRASFVHSANSGL